MEDILEELSSYPAIAEAKAIEASDTRWILIETTWITPLPNKRKRIGVSSSGVRDTEVVTFYFPPSYPDHAPNIRLRRDFPINLPHIDPHSKGDLVPPCVSDVPLSELLHSCGLFGILNAVENWLKNAASNELIDPDQGWEPICRTDSMGILIANTFYLRQQISKGNKTVFYYLSIYKKSLRGWSFGGIQGSSLGSDNKNLLKIRPENNASKDFNHTPLIVITNSAECDLYQAERVNSFEELLTFAEHFDMRKLLGARYKYIVNRITKSNHNHHKPIVGDFFVILAIKRPYSIIGVDGDLELLAYRVEVRLNKLGQLQMDSPCYPVMVQDTCTPEMLKAVSGTKSAPTTLITSIGCGSLGGKLAMHLAKSGNYGFQLIDNDYFSMHNNARQAIIETDITQLHQSKAELLDAEFKKLGVPSSAISSDVRLLNPSKDFHAKLGSGFILDSTASLAVRHFLSHKVDALPATLIQTYLLNRSLLGVVLIEGNARNPRIDDLNAYVYQLGWENMDYNKAIYQYSGPESLQFGDGCGSFTTQMTDMDIAIPSASMAANLNKTMADPSRDEYKGQVQLTHVNDDYSVTVDALTVEKTIVFETLENYPWEVRVLADIAKQIESEASLYPGLENGGVLIGSYDSFSQTIYVTGLIDAPEDTERTSTRFILGTKGVSKLLTEVAHKTGGQLSFIGTWHSHPNGEPPSPLDKATLHKLQGDTERPVTMLVQTGGRLERIVE